MGLISLKEALETEARWNEEKQLNYNEVYEDLDNDDDEDNKMGVVDLNYIKSTLLLLSKDINQESYLENKPIYFDSSISILKDELTKYNFTPNDVRYIFGDDVLPEELEKLIFE